MNIRYTIHALERLKERGIAKGEVARALAIGTKENASGGLRKAVWGSEKKILVVLYKVMDVSAIEIITAYYQT